MAGLVGGAALGAAFGQLLKVVVDRTAETAGFKTQLTRLEKTLKSLESVYTENAELRKVVLNRPDETIEFTCYLERGKDLVAKCSSIMRWDLRKRFIYTRKLIQLDKELLRFSKIKSPADCERFSLMNLKETKELNEKFDGVVSTATSRGRGFLGSCSVPGIPEFVIGFDQRLAELKHMLLKDDTRLLTISAPGGFGKTTFAKMLCHDAEIKGEFGDNILYVTVSAETSLKIIAKDLFNHYGESHFHFKSEEDARNQIENLIRKKVSSKMLLVLDDVWPKSEFVVQNLKFNIPGFKILVTSRFEIPNSTRYDLTLLNAEDAKTLFCHSAFPRDKIPVNGVSDALVTKIVAFCKGIPLALTVIGESLCDQLEVIWKATLKKWSEGQSILESHEQLLLCLQTSIDALDELHERVKECFLDLGLFPEDDQIAGTTLMDIWVELYELDDEGIDASLNLLYLSSRNLTNIVLIRKAAGETEGHCSQYRVTQHDVLRDLAIHINNQESIPKRDRLFMEINGNNFPKWWTDQVPQQSINAQILSISTDEEFNSTWYDLNAPKVKVLILNIRSKNYSLPSFIKTLTQLKVLIITGYGVYPTQLNNLHVLSTLSNLNRIRFGHVSFSTSVQVVFTLKTLKKLTFVMCKIGDAFNSGTNGSPYMLENLKELEIDLCYDLKELPAQICSSVQLKKLIITNCQELHLLPEDLGNLSNIEIMRLHCCTNLKELPESIKSMSKLRLIDVSDCLSITALPEQIGELSSLKGICISGCEGLDKLPMTFTKLEQLKDVWCKEEKSNLFKNIESDLCNMKINIVEEDITLTFKKICGN